MRALLIAGVLTGFGFVWFSGGGPGIGPEWSLLILLAGVEAAVFTGGSFEPLEPLARRAVTGIAVVVLGYGAEQLLNMEVSGFLLAAFVVVILLELGTTPWSRAELDNGEHDTDREEAAQ